MEKSFIRIHTGSVDTKYGMDIERLVDDPVDPIYKTEEDAIKALMEKLDYEPDEDGEHGCPGVCGGDTGAYFDYAGYVDVEIPYTIVKRIKGKVCPECGNYIECSCVVGSYESVSGLTERLYVCGECGFSFSTQTDEKVEDCHLQPTPEKEQSLIESEDGDFWYPGYVPDEYGW